ncbi:MAG TPA: FeoA domain-containing protein [Gammaproteobacteria bacterium]|jgi:Fe2+ transport system protein FeoA|nr:FeoA domain-containing protein [Gammaproteobacteria bacterium]
MNVRPNPIPTTLASLRHGERALVVDIGQGDPKLGAKLAARGVVPGVEVGVLRGGDPLLLTIDETRWAVTRSDADLVHVDIITRRRRSLLERLWRR